MITSEIMQIPHFTIHYMIEEENYYDRNEQHITDCSGKNHSSLINY